MYLQKVTVNRKRDGFVLLFIFITLCWLSILQITHHTKYTEDIEKITVTWGPL